MESSTCSRAEEAPSRSRHSARGDASLEDAVPEEMIEYPTGTFFGEMEFLGVSDSRPNSIRAKPGHIACELSSLHPKDIRGIVAESEALRWRMQKYKQLKQTLALMAAHGVDVRRAVTLVPRYTTVYKKQLVNAHIANLPADALLVYPDVDEFFEYTFAG